ncbi:Ig-like domain-containing protein [Aestuariivita sp.]|jgi:hypothetical protein|uniref:Ig-like domain-containing protein n=1 Tax=Aestuariivita sp. TaxID=1872407 RepID=UPI00216DF664|nr:Ig-like domain-containing protein [Aestuariivita sp.]MCE8009895.1 tandem-95 repeat protein [Aestuariivita sp.]
MTAFDPPAAFTDDDGRGDDVIPPILPPSGTEGDAGLVRPDPEEGPIDESFVPPPLRDPDVADPDPEEETRFTWVNDAFANGFEAPEPAPFDPSLAAVQQSRFTQDDDIQDFSESPQPVQVDGFAGDDRIIGSVFGDNIDGGAGDDLIMGGPGDDELDGDSGFDTAVYKGSILEYDLIRVDGDEFNIVDMSHNMLQPPAPSVVGPVVGLSLPPVDSDGGEGPGTPSEPGAPDDGGDSGTLDEGTDELEDFEEIRFADYILRLDGVNNAPFIVAQDVIVDEDTPIQVTFEVYDFDGDTIGAVSLAESGGSAGDVSLTELTPLFGSALTGEFSFDPINQEELRAGETLVFTITVEATDIIIPPVSTPGGLGWTAPPEREALTTQFSFDITVVGVNDPLTANDDVATMAEDGTVVINVLDNDVSDGGEPLSVRDASAANGEVNIRPDGQLSYTPNGNFNGIDTITYTLWNGTETSDTDTASVTVTVTAVNDDPETVSDTATVAEDGEVNINVLANDSDIDEGDELTVTSATAPNGEVTIETDGTLTYVPDLNFNGRDQITYEISDGNGGTATGLVGVTVTPVNDNPTANNDTGIVVAEDGSVVVDVLANDTDIDGDAPLFVSGFGAQSGGTAALTNDGQVRFTPSQDFFGSAFFEYVVSDGNGGSALGRATIDVTPVNDAPSTSPGTVVAEEDDGQITINLSDYVTELDGDGLNFSLIAADRAGDPIPFSVQDDTITGDNGLIVIDPELLGLDTGESAMTTFSYTVTDDSGEVGNDTATGTVTLTINGADEVVVPPPPNAPPVATALTVTADEAELITIDLADLGIDPDEGDTLTLSALTGTIRGSANRPVDFSLNETGQILIDPTQFFLQGQAFERTLSEGSGSYLIEGEEVTLSLNFTVQDSGSLSDSNIITLNLTGDTPDNFAPEVANSSLSEVIVDASGPGTQTIDLGALVSDPDGDDTLTITVGDLTLGGDDGDVVVNPSAITRVGDVVTIDLSALDALLADGAVSNGTLDFTVTDGIETVAGQVGTTYVDPLDDPGTDPVPAAVVLDFEVFADETGASIPIGVDSLGEEVMTVIYQGYFFQGPANVFETDELGGARGGGPAGIASGQTTPSGDNVLVIGTNTEVPLALVDIINPDTGTPYLNIDSSPVQGVPGSTVVLDEFGQPATGPDGFILVDDRNVPTTQTVVDNTAILRAEGGTLDPDAVERASLSIGGLSPEEALETIFGVDPDTDFNLDGLSLNVTGDGTSKVTLTTYRYEVTETPFGTSSFSNYALNIIEVDTFVFDADAATVAEGLDFNDAGFSDDADVPNTDRTAFDDIQAFRITADDDSFIVLDDIRLSPVEDIVPV